MIDELCNYARRVRDATTALQSLQMLCTLRLYRELLSVQRTELNLCFAKRKRCKELRDSVTKYLLIHHKVHFSKEDWVKGL